MYHRDSQRRYIVPSYCLKLLDGKPGRPYHGHDRCRPVGLKGSGTLGEVKGRIDYRMAKRALVRQVTRGLVGVQDVCDAHPELLRAARNVGRETSRTCPICRMADSRADIPIDADSTLREVTYVYGKALRQRQGRVVWTDDELRDLAESVSSFTSYTVECCLVCGWNHLLIAELHGSDHRAGADLTARLQSNS